MCVMNRRRFKSTPPPTPCFSEESLSLLSSNLRLQRALGERIVRLSRLKERNRQAAREVACSIATAASSVATTATANEIKNSVPWNSDAGISNRSVEELLHRRLQLQQQQQQQQQQKRRNTAASSGISPPTAPAAPPPSHPPATPASTVTSHQGARKRKKKAWQQTPNNRKWHRTYFVDAEGSTPQPNNDVARREERLRGVSSSLPPDTLRHNFFSKDHEETSNGNADNSKSAQNDKTRTEASEGDACIGTSTRSIPASSPQQKQKRKKHKAASRRGNPLTAEERASVRATFVESGGYPDWSRIIATSESADSSDGNKASAWDCFRYIQKEASSLLLESSPDPATVAAGSAGHTAAHAAASTAVAAAAAAAGTRSAASKNSSLPSQPWGSEEDATLLTAVMSLGPQFALSRDTVSTLARELFGDRSVKQIKKRANESLVNPNYRSTAVRWTDEEERMLVLLMKAYGHCPSPLVKVFAHFPNVASKSVAEKWMRLQRTNNNNNNNNKDNKRRGVDRRSRT